MTGTVPPGPNGPSPLVRTYSARRGRLSALTLERLKRLGPTRFLPEGPVHPQTVFGRVAPLVVEVGSGHGAAAVAYAQTHPGHDVLAVDVHTPGVARTLAAAEAAGVPNLRVAHEDAVALLDQRVAAGQLAAVHLFFPDPWPKPKHAKRRFVTADRLSLLASRLAPNGVVLVATDQAAYADHVRSQVRAHGTFVAVATPRPSWRPVSGFERKALEADRPIVDLRLERATRIELA